MQLSTDKINPRLLKCSYFNGYEMKKGIKMASRVCYDYEIEYYIKSNGGIFIEGIYTPFYDGEINIRKPGQRVCGYTQSECYIACISICGDETPSGEYLFGSQSRAQPVYENTLLDMLENKIVPANTAKVASIFSELFRVSQSKAESNRFKTNMLLYELLNELFNRDSDIKPSGSYNGKAIKNAVDRIKRDFCERLSIEEMIEQAGLSKAYFHRCFKEYTGMTPLEMITFLRIEKAKTLLCMTNDKISSICEFCGYDDDVYFSHIFKAKTGMTPTEFRAHMTYND